MAIKRLIRNHGHIYLLLLVSIGIVYGNALIGGFVYDDKNFIVQNRPVKTWLMSRPWDFFLKPEVAVWSGIYRPIRTLSFAIDYQFFGLNPFGYHLENILIHFINSILVYHLMLFLCGSVLTGLIASLLFAVHPVQIEAVTWISSRGDLLYALLVLICMVMYIGKKQKNQTLSLKQTVCIYTLYCIALLSKETAVGLVPALAAYDIFFQVLTKKIRIKDYIRRHILFYAVFGIFTVAYLAVRFSLFENVSQKPFWGGTATANFLTMFEATVYYFRLIFYPTDLSLDYSTYPILHSVMNPNIIYPLIFFPAVCSLLYIQFRAKRYTIVFFALIIVLFLLPSWNIIPISAIIAERFLYLSMFGICGIFAVAVTAMIRSDQFRKTTVCVTFFILSICMILGVYRNNDWRSDLRIWYSCANEFPGNFKAHINLGTCYDEMDEVFKALNEYHKLLADQPHHAMAHFNLGNIYWSLGLFEKSRAEYLEAIRYDPQYWEAYNNLGNLYVDKMWFTEALECFHKILESNPGHVKANLNAGALYYSKFKMYDKALYHFQKCMESEEFRNSSRAREIIDKIHQITGKAR
ncbi:MAG: tetratricopeptide repeat protein [Candidatus Auribacter fodinae]|jgi:hypothetical protein|uniref:Tetratricopeptide repeat protein n=1 Tax=Candidatus Auribacter fodinae TaxID=2093366 RepID=A0A3A4RGR6_9BACT|nr:MAG: tetratricopeptide repeat protein [Candidatus Auribacter fodinae]